MSHRSDRDDPAEIARRVAARKFGFFVHATVFVLVNLGLVAVNALTGRLGWSAFPLLGWGIGLLAHGVVALGPLPRFHRWLLERELARIGRPR